jgi:hypothetical protein
MFGLPCDRESGRTFVLGALHLKQKFRDFLHELLCDFRG